MADGAVSPPKVPQPTLAISWQLLLGAIGAVIVMRLGGIVSNFWMALGVIGFLGILALLQAVPFRRVATAVFIGWVAVSFGLPMIALALRKDWPVLAEAWRRHSYMRQLETAEWLDPVAYRARIGIARYCQKVDQIQGEWLAARLKELIRSLHPPPRPGLIRRIGITLGIAKAPPVPIPQLSTLQGGVPPIPLPASNTEQRVYDAVQVIEQHRHECRVAFSRQLPQVQAAPGIPSVTVPVSWLPFRRTQWYWGTAIVFAIGTVLSFFWAKIGRAIMAAAAFVAVFVLVASLISSWEIAMRLVSAARLWWLEAGALFVVASVLTAIFVPRLLVVIAVVAGLAFLAWVAIAAGAGSVLENLVDGTASPQTLIVIVGVLALAALIVPALLKRQGPSQGGQRS